MCGINGMLHLQSSKKIDERILIKMRDILEHRGPDDKGLFIENNIGFGHRRLSIIDTSSAGHQPFFSDDNRYVMIFNGEIYNYKDFYTELKSKGFDIKTGSDTEVLIKLFELYGLKMLHRLNGMFAIAIWDKLKKKLTLIRDRMGVKPLYYSNYNETLYFASEQKALFAAGVPLKIDENGLQEFIFNRFVAGDKTMYQNIYKLLPGHFMNIYESGKIEIEKWWDLKTEIQNQEFIKNPVEWFQETFDQSVKLRMVSDVPVGVLLSGGLDSSSIAASLKYQNFENINTFNIGFKEKEHNEAQLAEMYSKQLNYPFQTMQLENKELFNKLLQSTYLLDEPLTHLSDPHILAVSELAQTNVKVLLSGEGADELMGGYVRYKAIKNPSLLNLISKIGDFGNFSKNPRFDKLTRYSSLKSDNDLVMFNSSNIYPRDINNKFGLNVNPINNYRYQILEDAKILYPKNLRRQALYFDQHTYLCSLLDRNDRCTMGASIECREPFLDSKLIVGLGSLEDKWLFSGKKGKFVLKSAMQERLPHEILNFKKIGLSVPWGDYLLQNDSFKDEMNAFAKSEIFQIQYLENINIKSMLDKFLKGEKQLTQFILPLFMMHIWKKKYVNQFS
jgi:asparagine synthase (glutamine-hydrolysing)